MDIQAPLCDLWAKLIPSNPDKGHIRCYVEPNQSNEYKVDGKWKIYQKFIGDTWIMNLSNSYLKVDGKQLEMSQEQQLIGGEVIASGEKNNEENENSDYIFCPVNFQPKNELKRGRDETLEPSREGPQKLIKVDPIVKEEDLTCPICMEILSRCATLSPCGHNLCGSCLIVHLRNSFSCPCCKQQIASVMKHFSFNNIIEAAVKNSTNMEKPKENVFTIQRDLEGNIYENGAAVFIGSLLKRKKEGQGTFIYSDGAIYQGVWRNDKREGEGILIYPQDVIIKGVWLNDILRPIVEIKYVEGDWYQGETKDLNPYGKGIKNFADGNFYEGDFKDGAPEGSGKVIYKNGTEYEGDWVNGRKNGYGIMKYSDGDVYKGEWKNDVGEGKGEYKSKNGDKYEGLWMNGHENGLGKFTLANGTEYEANWIDGLKEGKGTAKFFTGNIFQGEWKEDKIEGDGIYTLKNGDKIEGIWAKGMLQPMVKVEYTNGEIYEGEINVDTLQKHGKGTLTLNNGSQYKGDWINDEYSGKGIYIYKDVGRVYEEFWGEGSLENSIITFADGTQYKATWEKVDEAEQKLAEGGKKS